MADPGRPEGPAPSPSRVDSSPVAQEESRGGSGLWRIPEVKICGLTRREDAEVAAGAGADYLGVVLVPGTPRAVSVSQGREITRGLGGRVVGVMVNPSLEEAVAGAEGLKASVVQLHGDETPGFIQSLGEVGGWKIWKALRVRDPGALARQMSAFAPLVDGILLDSWHPRHRGGTGEPFSWDDVAAIRSEFPRGTALIAAGGLNPENVREAIRHLKPSVVDVSSGVEASPGIKSRDKVVAFIRAAREMGKEGS